MQNKKEKPSAYSTSSRYIGIQSIAEIGLGSLLHSLHIPFSGHFLSVNQSIILTLAAKNCENRKDAVTVSNKIASTAALLKALAPFGKRLTPMLAISTQGFLFSLGLCFFSASYFGVVLGAALLSLWGFLQPLLIAYFLFGMKFFIAIESLTRDWAVWILALLVMLKIFLTWISVHIAWFSGPQFEKKYLERVETWWKKTKKLQGRKLSLPPILGACKDIFNPWFLFSFILSVGFFAYSGNEAPPYIVLYALRCLALGFLLFWIVRAFPRSWLPRDLVAEVTRRQY